jgi:hypothetical protein
VTYHNLSVTRILVTARPSRASSRTTSRTSPGGEDAAASDDDIPF